MDLAGQILFSPALSAKSWNSASPAHNACRGKSACSTTSLVHCAAAKSGLNLADAPLRKTKRLSNTLITLSNNIS
jgi:hypothetical protein